ncbi:GNAT family N-acetyltransferase [Sphingomonas sp.]|uniref:GNAT family N-acetyltransferase n=1 Tax=Sphingomonas sp. TaxID=28214 RepID=UPI002600E463|nr:GNAT family N-acetyltransferase [Sphingomonas sp.]
MWVKGEIFRNLADAKGSAAGLERDEQTSLFDRFDWFARTMEHCPPAPYPLIARARAEGSDAWLFLVETGNGKAQALASWYSLKFGPIFTGTPEEKTMGAMLTAIARRIGKRLSSIHLAPMTRENVDLLTRAFGRAHWSATVTETSCNWTVDVSGKSFAEYWAARPGELRSTVKRKGTKAGLDITIFDRFDSDAWGDYQTVYADSWKPEEGSHQFLRAMAEDEGAAGNLRLGIGQIDGTPVVAQLWTTENGVAIIHKLAHRDSAAEFSPGSLMSAAMFERAIDVDHVRLIDFGTGDDRYKADWMDTRTPLFTVNLYNKRTFAGFLGAIRANCGTLVARVRNR